MGPDARRKFHVLDGMIFVCSTAIALGWFIANWQPLQPRLVPIPTVTATSGHSTESRSQRAHIPDYDEEDSAFARLFGDAVVPTPGAQKAPESPPGNSPSGSYHPGKEDPQVGQSRSLTVKTCQAESLTDFSAGVIFARALFHPWSSGFYIWLNAVTLFRVLSYLLVVWSAAVLAVWFRRPRPAFRELIRCPGISACFVTLAVLAVQGGLTLAVCLICHVRSFPLENEGHDVWQVMKDVSGAVGPAILAVWLILVLGGCRGSCKDWVEMLGLAIGLGWFLLFLEPVISPLLV